MDCEKDLNQEPHSKDNFEKVTMYMDQVVKYIVVMSKLI